MGASVSLRNVARTFRRGAEVVHALRPTNLTIPEGAFATLMGPSGSGKSTLLNLVAGFDYPETGEIHIGDSRQDANREARKIGFIFQNFRLSPLLSAIENVELALLPVEAVAKVRRERAVEALGAVGLADRHKHRPSQLSGGQQQRVSVARAIAVRPDVILADEPTANLDTATGEQIMALLKRLSCSSGCTVILATHDQRWSSLSDMKVAMKDGGLVE